MYLVGDISESFQHPRRLFHVLPQLHESVVPFAGGLLVEPVEGTWTHPHHQHLEVQLTERVRGRVKVRG